MSDHVAQMTKALEEVRNLAIDMSYHVNRDQSLDHTRRAEVHSYLIQAVLEERRFKALIESDPGIIPHLNGRPTSEQGSTEGEQPNDGNSGQATHVSMHLVQQFPRRALYADSESDEGQAPRTTMHTNPVLPADELYPNSESDAGQAPPPYDNAN